MTATTRGQGLARFLQRLRALFNLNDPGWGRGAGSPAPDNNDLPPPSNGNGSNGGDQPGSPVPPPASRPPAAPRPQANGQNPPELGELIGDLNRKISGLFGGGGGGGDNRNSGGGNRGGFSGGIKPPQISGGLIGAGFIVLVFLWLASGVFTVEEGHEGVITRFGKYDRSVPAGLRFRWPSPIERHETVLVSQIRSMDIGDNRIIQETGLNHYAMLTEDENIVEVRFAVQYRLSNAADWLFNTDKPERAVENAAETAVREVVGKMKMDNVLAGERDQIGPRVRELMQVILDRYQVGVEVVTINMQQSGVRPPEEVRDAFDDVLRADQERERAKNDAEAYANNVIPRAVGEASRVREEALAYKDRIVAQAEGDAARFDAVYSEYQRAPRVTRDRLYLETMEEIYRNSNKVLVDTKDGSNLMYLPLDKLMEQSAQGGEARVRADPSRSAVTPTAPSAAQSTSNTSSPANTQTTRRPTRESR